VRVFFGALNRGADWAAAQQGIMAAAAHLGRTVEFVVVHDRGFHDALPAECAKAFHPTLPHGQYMQVLATCDLALLPLANTPFNRLKSDLKFIECCAAGVVPICSPVIYGEQPVQREIGRFADDPAEWREALVGLCSDPGELRRRRTLGEAYVRRERMHAYQVPARDAYYRGLLARHEELEALRRGRL
jgi:hypothetical protein